ncbi:LacI family DNA-binding transcriptional regulator [Ornithinibacillus halophilus]|uniref:Transcriptional regulator, LacI family n=1 Tax=Ornithinibacillus halophilus TaxID=930117 RepID=A0A1M5FU95_9BACI|nr:LacI family DNA-binding transcriptional regulator [Ornithinibacillus halophilus]SHF95068.1 transcriptional regulator, LacI family [Ornithinibacillus halophilus]
MTITIKDVAKKANVSIATVSRILNDKPGYSEETKKKVMQVIEELGYHPNGIARGLISKRSHTIGVLVPKLSSMLMTEFVSGIENITHQNGSSAIICHTESNGKKTMQYLQLLKEKQIDGIIFASELLTEDYYQFVKKMEIPIVLLSTISYDHPVPYVRVDDQHAAYSATDYLIKNGHKNIGMIGGNKEDMVAGQPRIDGYLQAMEKHNLSCTDKQIVSGHGFGFEDGVDGFRKLIEQFPEVTAVFAASDEIALGVISVAYQMGIKVPEQLSIIGYDNLSLAEMSIPPLTTVAQPLKQMGEKATEMVFDIINNNKTVESRIFPHAIVERDSVRKI